MAWTLSALRDEHAARWRYVQARLGWKQTWRQLEVEASVASARAISAPQTTFLHFVVGDGQFWLALTDEYRKRLVFKGLPLSEDELRLVHQRYREATPSPDLLARGIGLDEADAALDGLLDYYADRLSSVVGQIRPYIEGSRLKIFPRSFLNQVPWPALPMGGHRLIDLCDVSFGQSLAMVSRAHRAVEAPSPVPSMTTVMGASVPLYQAVLGRLGSPGGPVLTDPGLDELAHAVQDARGQLVFACHGRFDLDKPDESALMFGPAGQTSLSSLLGRLQLENLDAVFVGACESAAGRAEVSSEFIGLSNVFLAGGARYVVGALWRVNQLASAVLLGQYLKHLPDKGVPGALNHAQRDLKAMTKSQLRAWLVTLLPGAAAPEKAVERLPEPPFGHPRLWAGFGVQGDV